MSVGVRVSLVIGLLGCSAEPTSEAGPASGAAEALVRQVELPAIELPAIEPEPIEVAPPREPPPPPSNEPTAEFPRLRPGPAPRLAAVAFRDGPLALRGDGERGYLIVDGEARELGPAGLEPAVASDLEPIRERTSLEFGVRAHLELPDGDAFSATHLIRFRAGTEDAQLYRRSQGVWTEVEPRREPGAGPFADYEALFLREGGVFGLRTLRGELQGARGSAMPPEFVRLAGPPSATMPVAPTKPPIVDLVATVDGSVYALQWDYEAGRDHPPILLFWPPGRSEPEQVAVPEIAGTSGLRLAVSGLDVLLFGEPRYLAIGRGRDFRRLRVVLPEDDWIDGAGESIGAALSTPDGGMWITLDHDLSESGLLLYQAPGKGWTRVEPPKLPAEVDPDGRWFLASGWTEVRANGGPAFTSLAWAAGRVWILAEIELADDEGLFGLLQHEALYTVGAIAEPPTLVPAIGRPAVED